MGGISNYSHQALASVTPPLPHQALSKRDKKRNALSERLHDISANFAQNRDSHYRAQLHSLQLAMNFINNSEPYNDRPLNDNPNVIFEQLRAAVTDNAQRDAQAAARLNMLEVPAGTEKWAAAYVQEINDHLETRDATLAAIAVSTESCAPSRIYTDTRCRADTTTLLLAWKETLNTRWTWHASNTNNSQA